MRISWTVIDIDLVSNKIESARPWEASGGDLMEHGKY